MVENEYAKALYELAVENGKVQDYEEQFDALVETLKDKDFYSVMTAPNIDNIKKKDIVKNAYKGFDETFINFIYVLIDRNRVSIAESINYEFKQLILLKNDVLKIDVFSAKKLSVMELNQLIASLKKKYVDKKLEVTNVVKPELIGGIQIVSNGESLDISLKNSLDRLKDSL